MTRETSWDPPKITEPDRQEKEQKLKRQLERFIADLLLSYRDNDAQVGRITKDDDYRWFFSIKNKKFKFLFFNLNLIFDYT